MLAAVATLNGCGTPVDLETTGEKKAEAKVVEFEKKLSVQPVKQTAKPVIETKKPMSKAKAKALAEKLAEEAEYRKEFSKIEDREPGGA